MDGAQHAGSNDLANRTAWTFWKVAKWNALVFVTEFAGLIAIGVGDIILSVIDDNVGILTSRNQRG
jgi:hypothetical protein